MGRSVAIPANDQQARKRQALLRADHMHDALPGVVEAEQFHAVLCRILLDLTDHACDFGIGDLVPRPAGRNVMIGHAEGQTGLRDFHAAVRQPVEGVKRTLVDIMPIHPQQRIWPSSRQTISWSAQSLSIRVCGRLITHAHDGSIGLI